MAKKYLLIISCLTVMLSFSSVNVYADPQGVVLQVGYIDPNNGDDGQQKSPILVPEISLEDYILYFATPCDGCTLRLMDENDAVVYSVVIPTGTISLVLPSSLSGEYEIQIVQSNIIFWGFINL